MEKNRKRMDKQRTLKQNKSLWLLFEMLAEELNVAGYDMKAVLKPEVDISWNKDMIHDYLWIPIQRIMTNKNSTSELTSTEIDKIFETLNRHLGQKLGISCDFPSIETLRNTK
jgi:hypothetical protein